MSSLCVCGGVRRGSPKRECKPNDNENNIRTNVGWRKQLLGRAEDLEGRKEGRERGSERERGREEGGGEDDQSV